MTTISIITPWHNGAQALLPDYARAVAGADQVIIVDNASDPSDAAILSGWCAEIGGIYIRNEQNTGFAASNNQGYAHATGDVVIFLNSDVAPAGDWLSIVKADVRGDALFGPALQAQIVAGRQLPYLEGWCVAATNKTWEDIACNLTMQLGEPQVIPPLVGPWDADTFPTFYWEDNDLSLRALEAEIDLVACAWPIQHKGGQTAGSISKYASIFETNRRTFAERALAYLGDAEHSQSAAWQRFQQERGTPSDIVEHLDLIFSYAKGTVVELGTRSGVSTAALLAGVERRGGHVTSIDVDPRCAGLYAGHPQWTFRTADSRTAPWDGGPIDVLLVDTEHVYEVTQAELATWAPRLAPGSVILAHDTETFPGVRRAIQEWCDEQGHTPRFITRCHGLAVVEVGG